MTNQETSAGKNRPVAVHALYHRGRRSVMIDLSNGLEVAFQPTHIKGLESGANSLEVIEISPCGQGILFPELDAVIYLPLLLKGLYGADQWTSLDYYKQAFQT
jgi:hypothetical protein